MKVGWGCSRVNGLVDGGLMVDVSESNYIKRVSSNLSMR